MQFLAFIFWVFFLWFLFLLLRAVIKGFMVYRKSRRAFESMFGQRETPGTKSKKKETAKKPSQPRKKIDPTVGEYVHYEEIEITAEEKTRTSEGNTEKTTKITVEEQIVDVQWEDIP